MSGAVSWIPNWVKAALLLGFGFSVPVFLGVSVDPVDYLFIIGKTVSESTNPSTTWIWDWSATFYLAYSIVAAIYFLAVLVNKGIYTGISGLMFFFGGFLIVPASSIGVMLFFAGLIPYFIGRYRGEGAQTN